MSNSTGITERHARECRYRTGGRCNCSPTFQAQVYDAKTGRRLSKTFPTKRAAKDWRQDGYSQLRAGELSVDRGPKFEDAVERLFGGIAAGQVFANTGDLYKPATVRGYRSRLYLRAVPRFRHLRLAELTRRDVQGLVDDLIEQEFSSSVIDGDVTALKVLYRHAIRRDEVRIDPTRGVVKPAVRCKERRVVPYAEALTMLAALDAGAERTLWATGILSGLRMGELSALGREDIDLAANLIHVRRNWDALEGYVLPKNRKARKVPVPAALRDHLDQYLLDTDRDEHIFGTPRFVNRASHRARGKWEDAELTPITLHEARHTYASLMIAAGTRQKPLSTFMGHATTRITEDLYGHLFPGAEAEAASQLDAYVERQTAAQTAAHPRETAAQGG